MNKVAARWKLLAKTALGITLLAVLLAWIDLHELTQIFREAKGWVLLICIVASFITLAYQVYILGFIAWPLAKIPHLTLYRYTLIGRFFSLFLPSDVGGDVVKGMYLRPYFDKPSHAFAPIILHRLLGGLSTVGIAIVVCALYLPEHLKWPATVVSLIIFTGSIAAIATFYFAGERMTIVRHRLDRWAVLRKVLDVLSTVASGLLFYKTKRMRLFAAFALSGTMTILAAAIFMLFGFTLNVSIRFDQALVIASVTMLSVLVPLTPGGLGVGEGAFVITAGVMGISLEAATAVALLNRAMSYITSLPGGIFYLLDNRAAIS